MVVSKTSKFVRWTYYFNTEHCPPARTSLCAIFWRGCVLMPLLALFAAAGGGFLLWQAGTHMLNMLAVVCGVAGLLGLCYGVAVFFDEKKMHRKIIHQVTSSVAWQGITAVKSHICPIVEIK